VFRSRTIDQHMKLDGVVVEYVDDFEYLFSYLLLCIKPSCRTRAMIIK